MSSTGLTLYKLIILYMFEKVNFPLTTNHVTGFILEEGYSFISLKFKTENTNRYPYPVRVPVEMRAFQKNSAPIVFLLHVVNGFIDELELITADSSKIDSASITLDNVEYVVNEQVK